MVSCNDGSDRKNGGGIRMDKVKTAVKCAGVAAAYLLLLMFSKLLEFWIFTSKVTYEELLNQTWNWEAMPESFLFTFPYGLGIFRVLLITLSVTDHEEYILSRIMEIIAAEPGFDHIVSSHPCNTLVFPGLELRLKERTVHRNGELISMTHREFATLVYLANHPSWVFSAGQIYEEVWGEDGENCGTAVASVIGQIRRKLTPDMPKAGYIRTVLGSGYKFEVPQGMAE
jgi:two-component system response regulator ResD